MPTQTSDTNPKTEEILISLIRGKSISERLAQLASLTSLTINLSKRAIERANPKMNKRELDLLFIKYHYGEDFYNKVNEYLLNSAYEEK
jgi:hypothetical protein